jgi:hypothetical protein
MAECYDGDRGGQRLRATLAPRMGCAGPLRGRLHGPAGFPLTRHVVAQRQRDPDPTRAPQRRTGGTDPPALLR